MSESSHHLRRGAWLSRQKIGEFLRPKTALPSRSSLPSRRLPIFDQLERRTPLAGDLAIDADGPPPFEIGTVITEEPNPVDLPVTIGPGENNPVEIIPPSEPTDAPIDLGPGEVPVVVGPGENDIVTVDEIPLEDLGFALTPFLAPEFLAYLTGAPPLTTSTPEFPLSESPTSGVGTPDAVETSRPSAGVAAREISTPFTHLAVSLPTPPLPTIPLTPRASTENLTRAEIADLHAAVDSWMAKAGLMDQNVAPKFDPTEEVYLPSSHRETEATPTINPESEEFQISPWITLGGFWLLRRSEKSRQRAITPHRKTA